MGRFLFLTVLFLILLISDFYTHAAIKRSVTLSSTSKKRFFQGLYWLSTILLWGLYFTFAKGADLTWEGRTTKMALGAVFFISYLAKIQISFFLIFEDIKRLILLVRNKFGKSENYELLDSKESTKINRSEFLSKVAIASASIPASGMSLGVVNGAHNYKVHKKDVFIKNLPEAFDGFTVGQLSDIHSGSFYDIKAVEKGIKLMNDQKTDIICFTGDLVNNETKEVDLFKKLFSTLSAPMGVYSVLGNHDYGDYKSWDSEADKQKNLDDMILAHEEMGWRLLMDENVLLERGGQKIALIGVQNWGTGRFPKYGDLYKAHKGTEGIATKVLLSHDPSHWKAQVLPEFKDIDLAMAGHTHGFQFGIEIGSFKWSPAKYRYKEWAGLYTKDNQHLYVNRGFGFLGYPGRVGIYPEITVLTLRSKKH